MSLKENKYIRYFGGHDKSVVTLAMNPADDTFLSGSLDKTIRLWDLRSNHCQVTMRDQQLNFLNHNFLLQGLMKLSGRPVAAFDPDGLIFAAGINSDSVKLYDLRSFDKGPFSSFKLQGTLLIREPLTLLTTIYYFSWQQRYRVDWSEILSWWEIHSDLYQWISDQAHWLLCRNLSSNLHRQATPAWQY